MADDTMQWTEILGALSDTSGDPLGAVNLVPTFMDVGPDTYQVQEEPA